MTPTFNTGLNNYFGGKNAAGTVHQIINQLPRHDVFVAGFAGNCAVLRFKQPARHQLAVDLDADVLARWEHAGVETECEDFVLYLERWQSRRHEGTTTLFYLDPPYLGESRSTPRTRYRYEAFTTEWHERFLRAVLRSDADALFCISCYDNPLYQRMLNGWRKHQFNARTQAYTATETLYMNYEKPTPNQLHDTRFLGGTFRDRERAKRRASRFVRELNAMSPEDRFLVLRAVNTHFNPV